MEEVLSVLSYAWSLFSALSLGEQVTTVVVAAGTLHTFVAGAISTAFRTVRLGWRSVKLAYLAGRGGAKVGSWLFSAATGVGQPVRRPVRDLLASLETCPHEWALDGGGVRSVNLDADVYIGPREIRVAGSRVDDVLNRKERRLLWRAAKPIHRDKGRIAAARSRIESDGLLVAAADTVLRRV